MTATKSNVNPGQYKEEGRERQGEDIVHDVQKQNFKQTEEHERELGRASSGQPNFIPGAAPVGESKDEEK